MSGLDQSHRVNQVLLHSATKWIGLVQLFAIGDFQGKLVQLWIGLGLECTGHTGLYIVLYSEYTYRVKGTEWRLVGVQRAAIPGTFKCSKDFTH